MKKVKNNICKSAEFLINNTIFFVYYDNADIISSNEFSLSIDAMRGSP